MRRSLFLTLAFTLLLPVSSSLATDPFQIAGRYLGFGWGDGYHSQKTWPLASGPLCNCAPATRYSATQSPTPAATPKQASPKLGAPKAEPISPSDRPAAKTSMRRYPGR